jgi:hypothetical protein
VRLPVLLQALLDSSVCVRVQLPKGWEDVVNFALSEQFVAQAARGFATTEPGCYLVVLHSHVAVYFSTHEQNNVPVTGKAGSHKQLFDIFISAPFH